MPSSTKYFNDIRFVSQLCSWHVQSNQFKVHMWPSMARNELWPWCGWVRHTHSKLWPNCTMYQSISWIHLWWVYFTRLFFNKKTNQINSYFSECPPGYNSTNGGITCNGNFDWDLTIPILIGSDIDECSLSGICAGYSICVNYNGGYQCNNCTAGQVLIDGVCVSKFISRWFVKSDCCYLPQT